MKNNTYISERIVNISALEEILECERILIETLNKELEIDFPDMKKIKEISKEISRLHKKANSFEFCLERRMVKKKVRIF